MRKASASVASSIRYLFGDFIGDDGGLMPVLPDGLPAEVAPLARDGVERLVDYQSPRYARLYVERLRRFVGRRDLDPKLYAEIARLMAVRMAYEDPIRIAQLKLREEDSEGRPLREGSVEVCRFRYDELVGALPAKIAGPVLALLEKLGWVRLRVTMRFSTASFWSVRRLRLEAGLRRWRLYSIRYGQERVWVERWLHMIDRALVKRPAAAAAVIASATMIHGYGDTYRQGLADWHAIIDGLAKPTFDGVLDLPDLAAAVAQARAAATPDPRQVSLRREIDCLRAQAARA